VQNAGSVWADLQAGSDFAHCARLLKNMNVKTRLQKIYRGGETANAATDNCNLNVFVCHRYALSV
jgi:hypothetical protein